MYEIFLDIPGYEGYYQVSNQGNVRSLDRIIKYKNGKSRLQPGAPVNQYKSNAGYMQVTLNKDGKQRTLNVHRLVMIAFKANPDNKPEVNHINEDKTDNRLNNLEWMTHKENCNHGTRIERQVNTGLKNGIYAKTRKKVLCVETGKVYDSIMEAAAELNLDNSHITKCCNGRYKTTGGYHWKYYNPSTLPK